MTLRAWGATVLEDRNQIAVHKALSSSNESGNAATVRFIKRNPSNWNHTIRVAYTKRQHVLAAQGALYNISHG